MGYQIIEIDNEIPEPVSLSFLKAYMSIDADYNADDEVLGMFLVTSRELLEKHLNIGLKRRPLKVQWDGCILNLPYSPNGNITGVTQNGTAFTDFEVSEGINKTIDINGVGFGYNADYFYSITNNTVEVSNITNTVNGDLYEVIYETGYEVLPMTLRLAICAQTDYAFKKRGYPEGGLVSATALLLANGYSRNLVL